MIVQVAGAYKVVSARSQNRLDLGRILMVRLNPRMTGLAVTIPDAAKALVSNNEILASLEVEKGSWPVLLSAMHAVIHAISA